MRIASRAFYFQCMTVWLAVGTPLLAFAGALVGVLLNRRAAKSLKADRDARRPCGTCGG